MCECASRVAAPPLTECEVIAYITRMSPQGVAGGPIFVHDFVQPMLFSTSWVKVAACTRSIRPPTEADGLNQTPRC
jgi:hypothetical protein